MTPERTSASPPERTGPLRRVLSEGTVLVSFGVSIASVLFAFIVPLTIGPDALRVDPSRRFAAPAANALLGTDHLGRDLVAMIALGLRTSIVIALLVVVASSAVGWATGALSGYLGGAIDNVLSRVMDVFNAFPGLILAIALVTVLGPSFSTIVVVLILVTWVNYARVIRARVLSLKRSDYVVASRMYGTSTPRLLLRHVWPNTLDLMLSVSLVQIPNVMLAESTISFLGFGLQPPEVSLGLLISSEKDYLQTHALPVLVSGGVLVLVCAAFATAGLRIRRRWQA
ncbi:ABC transporter permease [Nonomuraea cypriaca]|nr:ABC transporter permease [Nonomuraea cypriaca]